jgi:hypothetical protein
MTETSSTAPSEDQVGRVNGRLRRTPSPSGAMLFPELVWAHHKWQEVAQPHELDDGKGRNGRAGGEQPRASTRPLESAYREKLAEFQHCEGEILNAYWCVRDASAVVLTEKNVSRLRWLGRRRPDYRLYRATDWVTAKSPAIALLLHHCDALAIRVAKILPSVPRRIAMEWIYAEESFLLGYLERTGGSPSSKDERRVAAEHADELKLIERYYDRAASKAARLFYFAGMIAGLFVLAAVGLLVASVLGLFGGPSLSSSATQNFFACYGAGAIGALVSVMVRMRPDGARGFSVDYEVGRGPLVLLGMFRPAIGAIFGTALFFALASSFIELGTPTEEGAFYFYAFLAFLAGFSERFAHVIFGEAELTLATALGGGVPPDAPAASEDERRRERADETDASRTLPREREEVA